MSFQCRFQVVFANYNRGGKGRQAISQGVAIEADHARKKAQCAFGYPVVIAKSPTWWIVEQFAVKCHRRIGETWRRAFRGSALARSRWLIHLARGAYMLPGDTLTRDGCWRISANGCPAFMLAARPRLRGVASGRSLWNFERGGVGVCARREFAGGDMACKATKSSR